MSGDRAVELLISKIYNWPVNEGTPQLELVFLPHHGHPPPLLATTVATSYARNCLNIQQHLRVTYPPQEHELCLKIKNTLTDRSVGEVVIDLQGLKHNGAQYLPLPRSDKVLKVSQGSEAKVVNSAPVHQKSHNTRFIEEREQFLKNFKQNSSVTSKQQSSRSQKDNFASKLYGLLQETKRLRSNMQYESIRRSVPSQQQLQIDSDPRLESPSLVPPYDEERDEEDQQGGSRLDIRNLQVIGSPSSQRSLSQGEPLLKMSFGKTPGPY